MSELSRFNNNPRRVHWEGTKRVLRYLKGGVGVGLLYKGGESADLWGYCYDERREGIIALGQAYTLGHITGMKEGRMVI